jgi:glycosyltransferase involved in cell wall biosynthesis
MTFDIMLNKKDLKIAIVHDFLVEFGGAERVLNVLCEMFPEAPIYTILAEKENFPAWLKDRKIETSFLQRWPKFLLRRKKWLLPFLPIAPETFNLREFDLIISSSGAWSKGVVTRLDTIHISYLHSPMRFAWDMHDEYLRGQKRGKMVNLFTRLVLNYIRLWDFVATDRPEYLIANSQYTKGRIKKYYRREAIVIYPPVHIATQSVSGRSDEETGRKYFLVVSRLSAYKNIDVIIEAFNKLELPLVIVGKGEQEKYLKSIAKKNIQFLGFQPDENLPKIYAGARAFVFSNVDDFGIAPVEAMLCGVPVLGIRRGGIEEIIQEGKTGEFFDAATPEVIADGVRRLRENEHGYDREMIRARAREFGEERFKKELKEFIESKISRDFSKD